MRVLILFLALTLVGCTTNNPWFNWAPGISPDHAASICDQARADVCSAFGGEEAIQFAMDGLAIGLVFQVSKGKMSKEDAIGLIEKAQALIVQTDLNSGQILSLLTKDNEDAKLIAYLAFKMGFQMNVGLNSTFLFDDESRAVILQYLEGVKVEIDMWA